MLNQWQFKKGYLVNQRWSAAPMQSICTLFPRHANSEVCVGTLARPYRDDGAVSAVVGGRGRCSGRFVSSAFQTLASPIPLLPRLPAFALCCASTLLWLLPSSGIFALFLIKNCWAFNRCTSAFLSARSFSFSAFSLSLRSCSRSFFSFSASFFLSASSFLASSRFFCASFILSAASFSFRSSSSSSSDFGSHSLTTGSQRCLHQQPRSAHVP